MTHFETGSAPSSPPGTETAPAATIVIFGAAGDLTKRLLMPSLYNLALSGLLADETRIVGIDRSDMDDAAWKADLGDTIQSFTKDPDAEFHPTSIDAKAWDWLISRAEYRRGDFADAKTFEDLGGIVADRSAAFYLAVPSRFFGPLVEKLATAGLTAEPEGCFRRLVIEKPFGSDLTSARALNRDILGHVREDQIYRIDHFMGKEPVESLLALRFSNRMFDTLWSSEHIDRVEITASETLGVEGRAAFYEGTGALRDMVPNHLFQLFCMVAMDAPSSLNGEAIRDEKTRLLAAIPPVGADDVVFGQYAAGEVEGRDVPAYRDEPGVATGSRTETYVALRLEVRNDRWAGVPFLLRTGKRLAARRTEIAVFFRPSSRKLFPSEQGDAETADGIVFSVDPKYAIEIAFDVKRPGPKLVLAPAVCRFEPTEAFGVRPNVGYEALLYDCLLGDPMLFQRADTIEAAWAVVDPALKRGDGAPEPYRAGSDGPDRAADLAGRGWRHIGNERGSP